MAAVWRREQDYGRPRMRGWLAPTCCCPGHACESGVPGRLPLCCCLMHVPPSALFQSDCVASHSWTLQCAALQDDVAFFWPGLLRALQGLDPEDPYFITGESRGNVTAGGCRGQSAQAVVVVRCQMNPLQRLLLQTTITADGEMPQGGKASWISRAACRAALTRQVQKGCAVLCCALLCCAHYPNVAGLCWLLRQQQDSFQLPSGAVQGSICERRTF